MDERKWYRRKKMNLKEITEPDKSFLKLKGIDYDFDDFYQNSSMKNKMTSKHLK